MDLESLMQIRVSGASRFEQDSADAPAAISIVTAADIRAHGWRTLADVLRAQRGFNTSYDRLYTYLNVRGMGRVGDNNNRIQLLIDGVRMNDPMYDQAMLGEEGPLDMSLIERIEIVRGPGSAVYGGNAFFAVINVITRDPRQHSLREAAMSLGDNGLARAQATLSHSLQGGGGLLLSASMQHVAGESVPYPEQGLVAQGRDGERGRRLFMQIEQQGWSLGLSHSQRNKAMPNAAYGQAWNQSPSEFTDSTTAIWGKLQRQLTNGGRLDALVYAGHYDYFGDYSVYSGAAVVGSTDKTPASWLGTELTLTHDSSQGHTWLVGTSFEHQVLDPRSQINGIQQSAAPGHINRVALFVTDAWELGPRHTLNLGLRYDHHSVAHNADQIHPRIGLIWRADADTTLKLLGGTSYRHPNYYECCYPSPGVSVQANETETVESLELATEHRLDARTDLSASLYHNRIKHHINLNADSVFVNHPTPITALGLELEGVRRWASGAQARASLSLQQARRDGALPVNSPRSLFKLNLRGPLWHDLRPALETQFVSARKTLAGAEVGSYWLTHLNLAHEGLGKGVSASLGVYNLFDTHYRDPAAPIHHFHTSAGGAATTLDSLVQDGRSLRLNLAWSF